MIRLREKNTDRYIQREIEGKNKIKKIKTEREIETRAKPVQTDHSKRDIVRTQVNEGKYNLSTEGAISLVRILINTRRNI